ncbi:MAG: M28 family metallopeptidase [Elusimicrobiales bacterium]|nr:M28 family metallopeptidase [Elusimicrobiales bacterium]
MRLFLLRTGLLLAAAFCAAEAAAAGGPEYLLLSQDPAFLEELSAFSETSYSAGRTRLVKLTVPLAQLPPALAARLRLVSPGEVYNGPAPKGEEKAADPAVLSLLDGIDSRRLMGYAEAITMTGKRSAGSLDLSAASGNRAAMDYIAAQFAGMGYAVERQCYKNRKADKECNILARRKAGPAGAKAFLVIGHMDSVGHENAGADDNASGSAGVLEMAKVLSNYKADHDLIFVAANGEETGIAGGYACVKKLKESGELSRIAWAVNMDMIAWNRDGILEIETNKEFSAHADWVGSLARTYTKLQPYIAMPAWGSDHVPFLEAGIPTYLSIEHWDDHNPCYHKACDKLESLSWDYAAQLVRLNLAVVAGKVRLTPLPK